MALGACSTKSSNCLVAHVWLKLKTKKTNHGEHGDASHPYLSAFICVYLWFSEKRIEPPRTPRMVGARVCPWPPNQREVQESLPTENPNWQLSPADNFLFARSRLHRYHFYVFYLNTLLELRDALGEACFWSPVEQFLGERNISA